MPSTNTNKHFVNKFGNMFAKEDLVTPVGRVKWVYLAEPNTKFGNAKYSVVLLVPKSDDNKQAFANILAECQSMASERYGKKVPEFKYPVVRDGDAEEDDEDGKGKGEEFKGCWWIKASTTEAPPVMDGKRQDVDPSTVKPGMQCRLLVQPIMFDNGFSYRLKAVQFVKDDGIRFKGSFDPKSAFAAFDVPESIPEVSVEAPAAAPEEAAVDMPITAATTKKQKLNVNML